jgi:hypothetical protein
MSVIAESPMSKIMSECTATSPLNSPSNSGYTFVRKNTFLEVVEAFGERGRSQGRATSMPPSFSREATPTRKPGSGGIEDRSTDTGSTNKGTPTASPTLTTRSLNQQPMHQWQQQPPFSPNNFWGAGPPPAGFHPMEGENNMEWHGPNGPTYDNMMYDGNNQWNGYMHHGNNNYDEWMMDHYGWDDENGEYGEYGRDRRMHHDKRMGMNRDKRPNGRRIQRGDARSKVFVGGLCSRTTDESLRAAFEHFGNVINASVLVDAQSRRSRGFGYVTFMGEVPDAVSDRDHEVDGRMCGARLYKYN